MDLRKYKYIRNVKPRFNEGKSQFKPFTPGSTNTSSLQFNTQNGPKLPDVSQMSSALNPDNLGTTAVSSLSKAGGPQAVSALSQANFGQKANAALGVAGKALGAVSTVMNKVPVMGAINFGKSLGNAFSTKNIISSDELSEQAGTSEGSVNGISYEKANAVDGSDEMKALKSQNKSNTIGAATSGASLGMSIGGPIGGVLGGVAGLVGGLFGGNKRERELRRRIREAKRANERSTSYNRSSAQSQGVERDYYAENEDNTGDIIYANRGKDMNKVWTPTGYRNGHINSMVGKGESIINFNRGTGTLVTKGKRGVDNQPSSVRPDDDNVILGNDIDWTNGMRFSDQAAPLTAQLQLLNNYTKIPKDYDKKSSLSKQTQNIQMRELNRRRQPILDALGNISARQEKQHQIENKAVLGAFDNGKDNTMSEITVSDYWRPFNWFNPSTVMDIDRSPINYTPIKVESTVTYPDYDTDDNEPAYTKPTAPVTSWRTDSDDSDNDESNEIIPAWQRMIPSAFGMLQSWNQFNTYDKQPIRYTNTYRSNPYARQALRGMASLRYNMYPELQAIRDAERRGAYALSNQGGLTAGQRAAARVANTIATQRNLSNVYANASAQNNKYKQNYYNALISAGQADRAARMSAAQQDYANYVAAHGAKYKGRDTAVANMIDQMNNWYANEFKYRTYKDTADIYRQDLDNKRKALAAGYNSSKATNNNPTTTTTNPTTTAATNYSSLFPSMTQQSTQTFNTPFGSAPIWNNPLDWSFKNLMRYTS